MVFYSGKISKWGTTCENKKQKNPIFSLLPKALFISQAIYAEKTLVSKLSDLDWKCLSRKAESLR